MVNASHGESPSLQHTDVEGIPGQKGVHHDDHKGFHHEAPAANLLRPGVRHLMWWHPPLGRSWRNTGLHGANRNAAPVRGLGDARRSRRSGHPFDRLRLWKGGPSPASTPVAQVAGGRPLVRGGAPDCPPPGDGGTPRALANLPDISPRHIHVRRQGCPSAGRYRVRAGGGLLRGAGLDGGRRARAEAALRGPWHRGCPT